MGSPALHFEADMESTGTNGLAANTKLSIVVLGASGDLAKKYVFPSLFELFQLGYVLVVS